MDSKVIVSGQSRSLLNDTPNGIRPRSARHPDDFAAMSDGIGAISNVEHAPNAASPPDHMLISSLNDLPNGAAKVADHLTTSTQSAMGVSSTIVTPQSRIPTSAHKTQQIEEERLFLEAHTRRDILFERSEAERESGAQTRQLEFEAFQGRSEQSFLWMQDKRQRSFEARINHRDGGEKTRVERFRVLQTQLQTIFEGDLEAKLEEAQHWIGPNKWRERVDSLFDYMDDVVQRTLEESINSILRFPVNSVAALTSARSRPEDNFVGVIP